MTGWRQQTLWLRPSAYIPRNQGIMPRKWGRRRRSPNGKSLWLLRRHTPFLFLSSFLVLSSFFLFSFRLILFSSVLRLSGISNNGDTVVLRSCICPFLLSIVELDYTSQRWQNLLLKALIQPTSEAVTEKQCCKYSSVRCPFFDPIAILLFCCRWWDGWFCWHQYMTTRPTLFLLRVLHICEWRTKTQKQRVHTYM